MIRLIAAAGLCLLSNVTAVQAAERELIGYGRLINNDFLGDTQDRWRTGSVASSRVWGPSWTGQLPEGFGQILEVRLNAQFIAPDNLVAPAVGDRPYAASLSLGLHTHFRKGMTDFAVGADLVFTGPQTGLDDLQDGLHDALGVAGPSDATLAGQIDNGVYPTLVLEAGRDFAISETLQLRPFVEARWGDETLVRAGADLMFGGLGQGELLVRDPVTGQRYRAVAQPIFGYGLVLGADIAHVADSVYLPTARGMTISDARSRVRAGLHWQGDSSSVFYGVTWLGEEFQGQGSGQLVGSVHLNLDF